MKKSAHNRLGRATSCFLATAGLLLSAPHVFAYLNSPTDDSREDYAVGMSRKLGRGVANAGLGWTELFKGMQDVSDEKGFWAGATWGPIYGTVNAVRRTAVGVYETATFPLQNANHFEPVLDPEYPLTQER